MFSTKDLNQIHSKRIEINEIEEQLNNFKQGFPFALLENAATINNGIKNPKEKEIDDYVGFYDIESKNHHIVKFVPASGAASRMFKSLFSFLEDFDNSEKAFKEFIADKSFNSVFNFINSIKDFAFFKDLKYKMQEDDLDLEDKLLKKEYSVIIDYLLNTDGLDYGKLPKGLLKFHRYNTYSRMPIEEHMVEASNYGIGKNGNASIHFTVSPEHLDFFKNQINLVKKKYEDEYGISFDISFSVQKSSTDTIAVDMDNNPFREKDHSLLFRPAGHGALIENLNDLNGDIVFIKNIDNVVPDKLKTETTIYKKAIGGILLKLQSSVFSYLELLENNNVNDSLLNEITEFAKTELNIRLPEKYEDLDRSAKISFLITHLNRPIRICGMVKNEGEPGGGPFWVKNSEGEVSLQIVESSQINQNDKTQNDILKSSTHFNPVDIVCGLKNFKGKPFDLHRFIDKNTGFISTKSKDGKSLKAQELPGLWNGAMANWITLFVEVPVITFNPVKVVNDLLREQHQS